MYSNSQPDFRRVIVEAERPGASGPSNDWSASLKPPVLMPLRYSHGSKSSSAFVLRRYGGRIDEDLSLLRLAMVADSRLFDLDRTHRRLERTFRHVAVANDLPAALGIDQVRPSAKIRVHLALDRLGQHFTGPVA